MALILNAENRLPDKPRINGLMPIHHFRKLITILIAEMAHSKELALCYKTATYFLLF